MTSDDSIHLERSGIKLRVAKGEASLINGNELKFYSHNTLHEYTISFRDENGELFSIERNKKTPLKWNDDDFQSGLVSNYPYKDDSSLPYNQVFALKGFNRSTNIEDSKIEFSSSTTKEI
jgi:hypothetical protein